MKNFRKADGWPPPCQPQLLLLRSWLIVLLVLVSKCWDSMNLNHNQRIAIGGFLTDSELTIHDSSIWVLSKFPLKSSFYRQFSSTLRQLPCNPWGPYWVTGFWIFELISKWRLSFPHRKSSIRLFDSSWLACNPWPLVLKEMRAHRDSQFC